MKSVRNYVFSMHPLKPLCAMVASLALIPCIAEELVVASAADSHREQNTQIKIISNVISNSGKGPQFELTGPEFSRFSLDKVIKDAPYRAEVVNEFTHKLADGNVIQTRSVQIHYRDSAGRVRTDNMNDKGELVQATIVDPDKGTFMLDPIKKTALKMPTPSMVVKERKESADKIKHGEKNLELPLPDAGGETKNEPRIIIKQEKIIRNAGDPSVTVHSSEMPMHLSMAHGSKQLESLLGDFKWSAKRQTKNLGQKEMLGLNAEGKVSSYEIPAGEVGNKNPIVISDESWYAPELKISLLTKHADPRHGERVVKVSSLKRDEPNATLFQIPADFKLTDLSKALNIGNISEIKSNASKVHSEIRIIRDERK